MSLFRADLRRYVLCLALALAFAMLPLSFLLAGSTEPCEPGEGLAGPGSGFASGNPFGHQNLCRIRERLAHLRRRDRSESQKAGVTPDSTKPGGQAAAASQQPGSPRAALVQPMQPPLSRIADFQEGGDIPDIEWPQTDADRARIKTLPHVDSCFFCKVCIPASAVNGGSPADAVTLRQMLQQHDDQQAAAARGQPAAAGASSPPFQYPDPVHYGWKAPTRETPYYTADEDIDDSHNPEGEGMGGDTAAVQLLNTGLQKGGEGGGRVAAQRRQRRQMLDEKEDDDIARRESESDPFYHLNGTVVDLSKVAPGNTWRAEKETLPNCTICHGCANSLDMMASGSIMAGSYYAHEPGGSPSWLFRIRTNKTASGYAVVKTWCIPVLKAKQRGLANCIPRRVFSMVKLLLAQQKLTEECGFQDIVPKLWIAPVNGVIPGNGFHISWLGLWADIAEGVSVQNFHEFGSPKTKPQDVLKMLTETINSTSIVRGSIFDLLFSQCDRHQQNLFITETGKVTLIDNDQVFTTAWRKCGYDSLTIPVAQKYYINQLGFFYVMKYPQTDPPKTWNKVTNPLLLLDYRCHAPGGAIGKNFDPQLEQCMRKLRSMTALEIQEAYGYPHLRMADAIRNRSRDLLEHGFEWTLLHGQPTNMPMHRYKVPQKCCNMTYSTATNKYACTTPWEPKLEIPYGNPWHGGKWHGPEGMDTGTFAGGTAFI